MAEELHVCFVCTGNICRSPMAQNIFRAALDDAGLGGKVRVTSCGVAAYHVGEPADNRARTELVAGGYSDAHVAAVLGPEHFDADLFVAADSGHVRELVRKRLGDRTRLLRSFDPTVSEDELDLLDPYYGGVDDFVATREQIESAVPGLLAWVREQLGID
ncbi:low molecular weight protein-tyrosine-phosphatase [Gordonia paraffinivorans]|uniref:protein-tyrosine-phosphatase n=1 Tax=Gordonia paraffinivorans TaxID=175628 RepID=A0ABD7V099_9ACTN|nr:low molecular weight protein-tyrosine-phosphatase [Gordonia paraffinivorans]MBY4574025.1 protein tyrosine phosphatase [Gordonia paraffinivorans]MCD2144009.1 low molecular weight phosphotyrosine protein phosphatase [Gordonia paraffinivorans]PWD42168.1 protein tyrosine phosphatase [Gordonia paraffinivorans]VFA82983.1 Probable low molecular weight protein-tyrosine-phosphatase [Gordonia paraffinivorans]